MSDNKEKHRTMNDELLAMALCQRALEGLGEDARCRVLDWLIDRNILELPFAREIMGFLSKAFEKNMDALSQSEDN